MGLRLVEKSTYREYQSLIIAMSCEKALPKSLHKLISDTEKGHHQLLSLKYTVLFSFYSKILYNFGEIRIFLSKMRAKIANWGTKIAIVRRCN